MHNGERGALLRLALPVAARQQTSAGFDLEEAVLVERCGAIRRMRWARCLRWSRRSTRQERTRERHPVGIAEPGMGLKFGHRRALAARSKARTSSMAARAQRARIWGNRSRGLAGILTSCATIKKIHSERPK